MASVVGTVVGQPADQLIKNVDFKEKLHGDVRDVVISIIRESGERSVQLEQTVNPDYLREYSVLKPEQFKKAQEALKAELGTDNAGRKVEVQERLKAIVQIQPVFDLILQKVADLEVTIQTDQETIGRKNIEINQLTEQVRMQGEVEKANDAAIALLQQQLAAAKERIQELEVAPSNKQIGKALMYDRIADILGISKGVVARVTELVANNLCLESIVGKFGATAENLDNRAVEISQRDADHPGVVDERDRLQEDNTALFEANQTLKERVKKLEDENTTLLGLIAANIRYAMVTPGKLFWGFLEVLKG